MCPAPAAINPEDLLRQWLAEEDEIQASSLLEALMVHADGTIRRIVGSKLGRHAYGSRDGISMDVDDVSSTALVNLLSKMVSLKAGEDRAQIQSFVDYTAAVAFNACNEYFRDRHPEWYSLANQLRYLLRHAPGVRLWKTIDQIEMCGDVAWEGRPAVSATESLREALQRWRPRKVGLDLLPAIFQAIAGPVEFDTLVEEVAQAWGIKIQLADIDEFHEDSRFARSEPSPEEQACTRQFMQWLWTALKGLPLKQRRPLLLNMKDTYGCDVGIFDWFGIATIEQIAETLEIPTEDFARMWKELPISDRRIAKLWGSSVQQIINWRSEARKKLRKQRKDFDDEK